MAFNTIGDLASALTQQYRSTSLKQEISALTGQLSSGRLDPADLRQTGRSTYIAEAEAGLARLEGYTLAATEAKVLATAIQTGLGRFSDAARDLSALLVGSATGVDGPTASAGSDRAGEVLPMMMQALNLSVAGRAVFAGTATDTTPLASAQTLLGDLRTALAGLTTASDIRAAATAWFDSPSGFDASVYAGGTSDVAPVRISDGHDIALDIRADDPAIKAVLRETALAALAGDPALGLAAGETTELRTSAATKLAAAQDGILALQAKVGFRQGTIEEAQARNTAARFGYETSRNELLAADPFDVANRLEVAQYQLQALYAVTARSSALKLVNFL